MTDLVSVAIKCHDLDAMVAFYTEVLGGSFGAPLTFGDMTCRFGRVCGIEWKLVSGRETPPDFVGYPTHQLGLRVADLRAIVALAEEHGGRREGEVATHGERITGCIRDPDGNTLELEEPQRA